MGGEARLREGDQVTDTCFEPSQYEGPVRGCVGGDLGPSWVLAAALKLALEVLA